MADECVGTLAFHAMLHPVGQATDELAMICASMVFLYVVLEADHLEAQRSWLPALQIAYAFGFAVAYFTSPFFFPFFVAAYGCTVLLIIFQAYRVYKLYAAEDTESAKWQRLLFWVAATFYPAAFLFLWVPENALCPIYPELFQALHLHAMFHIATTISPYCYVVFMTYHRCTVLKRDAEHRRGIGLAYVHVALSGTRNAWKCAKKLLASSRASLERRWLSGESRTPAIAKPCRREESG
ncbi:hypothetical protein AK812_SmicGene4420 [Symbiodinium microadriaticum]|uniref:Uncharacterized protein n=1 Tax=Symbiodinium microadriaticum TaxID=2951 RepID=A0A1Q9EWE9_SYMMI|nr:hypothetical protein AK812_SmicGene4420 [Symbiodinium microadriaticum]